MISDLQNTFDTLLEDHGLRRTAFRREVMAIFYKNKGTALTNADIEQYLGDFDRITLYRTLKSFEDNGIIHEALTSGGQAKFALCGEACDNHNHHDHHVHFHCNKCGETSCIDQLSRNLIDSIPTGYEISDIQISMTGICNKCSRH